MDLTQLHHCCPFKRMGWIVIFSLLLLVVPPVYAAALPRVTVNKEKRISADIQEIPIAEALKKIGERLPLQVIGRPPEESVGLQLRDATLQEALRKIMKGYNYVLVDSGASGTILAIMGSVERGRNAESPMVHDPPPPPATAVPSAPDPDMTEREQNQPAPSNKEAETAGSPKGQDESEMPAPPPSVGVLRKGVIDDYLTNPSILDERGAGGGEKADADTSNGNKPALRN